MDKRLPYSRAADVSEDYITPTDVKQYVFCPRVTFFTRVMNLRPIMGSQQEDARNSHNRLAGLEQRRVSLLKTKLQFSINTKAFDVHLISDRIGVNGRLDMLVITDTGEYIPIEFKEMVDNKGQVHLDHKYQLITLGLLVEDNYSTVVRRGVIHYAKTNRTIVVNITERLKRMTEKYIQNIRDLLIDGLMPEPNPVCKRGRVGCGFADRCIDY
jgi:CRISPR-associated exonuclease Cas4